MHNLGTVFQFEVIRTLKKKSFWVMSIAFPIVIAGVFGIVYFSNKTTFDAANKTQDQHFSLAITDESRVVSPNILTAIKAQTVSNKQAGIDEVKQGKIDAYFYYPSDLSKGKVQVYAKDVGLFDNSRYQGTAEALLSQSIQGKVDPQLATILQKRVSYDSTTYRDGKEFDGIKQLIAPGMFLVLFYILIIMFGNQMLTSTTEEKENRVTEMMLTTIKDRTLIFGKILSVGALALIQIVIILIPILILYAFIHTHLSLPFIDLSHIPLDPVRVALAAGIFISGFIMFTGLLVAIGAAVPTAKEAGGFFGIVMALTFGPLYAASLFISSPDSILVKVLSFFPLTAPIPLLLRNAVGNLSIAEGLLGIVILTISAAVIMSIAVRLFHYGALEYSSRLSLRTIFRGKKRA